MKTDRNFRLIVSKIYNHESLVGSDLRNLYFSCMDFARMDLRHANFEGARLSQSILDRSDLTNANFANADLKNASFHQANLTGAVFRNSIVSGANFADAKGLTAEVKNYLRSKGATGL
jgi:uncharacterized protein YjbI with pentapeptide repeats